MPSFAESPEHRELLDISKSHLDALDRSRIIDGKINGRDNYNNLKVSTVFAAVAIEAALNDYLLCHCLFIDTPYLQQVFGKVMSRFLYAREADKIDLLKKHWSKEFPSELLHDVSELFRIRNRIVHQKSEFRFALDNAGDATMSNSPLAGVDLAHMLRHYDIANSFLGKFWLPGNREIQQGQSTTGENDPA